MTYLFLFQVKIFGDIKVTSLLLQQKIFHLWYNTFSIGTILIGERSQVVKALGCGSSIRGFDSRRSP